MFQPPYHFDPNYRNPCWKENNTLRCLPYFLIAGVKKCGTTEIWSHLLRHPGVVAPGFKEAQWFARRRFGKSPADTQRLNNVAFTSMQHHNVALTLCKRHEVASTLVRRFIVRFITKTRLFKYIENFTSKN